MNKKNAHKNIQFVKDSFREINNKLNYLMHSFNNFDNKQIGTALTELINEDHNHVYIALNILEAKVQYIIMANKEYCLKNNFSCNELIKKINQVVNGSGGGRDTFAQGGCINKQAPELIKEALK